MNISKKNSLYLSRAALGIYAILKVLYKGDYVAVPWNVCHELIFAVIQAGKIPYFVRYESPYEPITESELRKIPKEVDCLLHVHIYGELHNITESMRNRFCLIIDDAAQALGAGHLDAYPGMQGDFGVFSFGPTKQCDLGGGALLFSNNSKEIGQIENFLLNCRRLTEDKFIAYNSFNRIRIMSKVKNFEKSGDLSWKLNDLKQDVIFKKDNLHLDLEKLIDELNRYNPESRKNTVKLFLDSISELKVSARFNFERDNLWRITIKPSFFNFDKYINCFKSFREKNIKCSNWYYPANAFCHNFSGLNLNIQLKDCSRFQFSIENDGGACYIDRHEKILQVLEQYYG